MQIHEVVPFLHFFHGCQVNVLAALACPQSLFLSQKYGGESVGISYYVESLEEVSV